ncbi:hypothetical protein BDF21DRAFT_492590 [Thamnidium elegans]|nr:hypothetical protein BDF21DRAFT_492590 [Thamnidium elegans]
MTYIKPDPETQEEQEDLIMSYLNADYLSTDSTPLSPPSSTSSASDTTGSPEKRSVDDFMLDINTADFLNNNDHWATNTDNLFNPCFPQQVGGDLLGFPFFLSPPTQSTNFIQPFLPMSSNSSTGSVSDTEQPKKKRGRKKREPILQTNLPVQPSLLAPKPLAPRPNSEIIKMEPIEVAGPPIIKETPIPQTQEAQKAAQIQKRQERLIKNRAAALLSRKRKREHLSCLEEEKQLLVTENENLLNKVATLENKVACLEKENLDLKQHLQITSNPTSNNNNNHSSTIINIGANKRPLVNTKSSKATGVVFMIMLFSFALFTLPSRTADRLTVGGSVMDTKKQFPLIGSSHHVDYSMVNNNHSTDLVLIDAVRPRDLQSWINHKTDETNDIQAWSNGQQPTQRHVYLYSKEFSQIAPMHTTSQQFTSTHDLPILSLISPYNTTEEEKNCEKKYLQIDVQVLRSTVINSQLLPMQQCDVSLFDGLKNDLIINQNYILQNNVTPSIIVKREKRAKKLARVIT